MLERIEHDNGVVSYRSPLLAELGVVHAFSTRVGGVSEGRYAGLNLGSLAKGSETDANARVSENFRRLRAAVGLERVPRIAVRQVHGAEVHVADETIPHERAAPAADAIVTAHPRRMLTIRTADCVPILLADATGRRIAAVHAGWRSIVAGVVERTVAALQQKLGVEPGDLTAAVGPSIGAAHFEVGEEVAAAFEAADLGASVRREPGARPHIDLRAAVRVQLCRAGVAGDRIDATDACTYADAATFYSHRRDGEPTGRMAAVIAAL